MSVASETTRCSALNWLVGQRMRTWKMSIYKNERFFAEACSQSCTFLANKPTPAFKNAFWLYIVLAISKGCGCFPNKKHSSLAHN